MNRIFNAILIGVLLAAPRQIKASVFSVNSAAGFSDAIGKARSSDTIIWNRGTYQDVLLEIKTDSLFILAEKDGEVILTGNSSVKLLGSRCELRGFQFASGKTDGDVIRVEGSHNNIAQVNISRYVSKYYLNILPSSQYTEISYCNFERKPEKPESSVVEVQVAESQPGYHMIRYCSFRNHTSPPGSGGDYGIEALRIGYSFQSKFISRTLVEYCYFESCLGDGEIISSKARQNVYRYNTFYNNGPSHFTLRHGSENHVYGNFFLKGAGVRIKEGQEHAVFNNYFETGSYFSIMLANYKVDPLDRILIAHNTFVNSGPVVLGGEGDYPPRKVGIFNNFFQKPEGQLFEELTNEEVFGGNLAAGTGNQQVPQGVRQIRNDGLERNVAGYYQPVRKLRGKECPAKSWSAMKLFDQMEHDATIALDIAQNGRPKKADEKAVGCLEYQSGRTLKLWATSQNTGPFYLKE
ncbi:MAG: chondroitinase-B domain-containing protein [Prolixibacteraceae bacterium]